MDLDVKIKAVLLGACILIVSYHIGRFVHILISINLSILQICFRISCISNEAPKGALYRIRKMLKGILFTDLK